MGIVELAGVVFLGTAFVYARLRGNPGPDAPVTRGVGAVLIGMLAAATMGILAMTSSLVSEIPERRQEGAIPLAFTAFVLGVLVVLGKSRVLFWRAGGSPSAPSRSSEGGPPVGYEIRGADGREYGPADLTTMQSWIASGRVGAGTPVRRSGTTAWTAAASVRELAGLFPSAES